MLQAARDDGTGPPWFLRALGGSSYVAVFKARPVSNTGKYVSVAFGKRSIEASVRTPYGLVGDAHDKAMAESFVAILGPELLGRHRFASQAEARKACSSHIKH